MNAVIYARYSSDNQREESIDAQLRICRRHCEERGYKIVREYVREYSQELLSPKRVRAVINAWKELEDDDSLHAMVRTFTRAVIVGDGVADIDLCLSIGASEYSASNLHQSVTLLE